MSILLRCSFILAVLAAAVNGDDELPRQAVAILISRDEPVSPTITGTIVFTETDNGLRVNGILTGLPQGKYGFHVHAIGNIATCAAAGPHFNPYTTNHGGRDHTVRHVGDLGNIEFVDGTGIANIDFTDNILTLRGHNNILGRTLVLHAEEDDLGTGGNEESLLTGNAGARVACGVIGIMSPIEPWNSAVTSTPSLLLFIAATLLAYIR